jgi:hypothetical protein
MILKKLWGKLRVYLVGQGLMELGSEDQERPSFSIMASNCLVGGIWQ